MATRFGGRACADPATLRRACEDQGLPLDWWGRGNLFRNPLGRGPGAGAVLLTKADLDALTLTADHDLVFEDDRPHGAGLVTLKRITLLRAKCLTPGHRDDARAVYLCDVADRRHFLAQIPVDAAYNVRDAAGTGYLDATLDGSVAWTWAGVVQDLWTALGLGTAPSLPFTPDGTPENLRYHQAAAWEAVNDVFDRIGCAVRYEPVADAFSFVRLGDAAADGAVGDAAELARLDRDGKRTWDAYHREPDRGRLPEKVRVVFPRRPWPTDGTSPYYAVDVTLAATAGVQAGTYVVLHDDLTALGSGTPTNAAALATRAAERAADWRRKRLGYERRLTVVYRDFRAALRPGEAVGAAALDDRGGVMATELDAGPDGALERWRPWEPASTLGGDATDADCRAALAGLRRDEQVVFTVPAGYGVDDAEMGGSWDTTAPGGAGWVSAGTVRTSDGDTTLILFDKAEGGKGLRAVGETQTWYGEEIDCADCGRLFALAITPPALEEEGSASGSGSGSTACADHTFRVCVKCRAVELYDGCDAFPTGATCYILWTRPSTVDPWVAHDITGSGPAERWWVTHSGFPCFPSGSSLYRCGFYVGSYGILIGNPALASLSVLNNPGNGGLVWGAELYSNGCGVGTVALPAFELAFAFDPDDPMGELDSPGVPLNRPAPTDRPWRLRIDLNTYIQAYFSAEECAAVPPPPPPPPGDCCDIPNGTACSFVVTGGLSAGTYNATFSGGSVTFGPIPSDGGTTTLVTVSCFSPGVYGANGQAQDGTADCGPPVTATWTGASLPAFGLGAGATSAVFTA